MSFLQLFLWWRWCSAIHNWCYRLRASISTLNQWKLRILLTSAAVGMGMIHFLRLIGGKQLNKRLLLEGCTQLCICLRFLNHQLKLLDCLPALLQLGHQLHQVRLLQHQLHLEVGPHSSLLHRLQHHLLCSPLLPRLLQYPPCLHRPVQPLRLHLLVHYLFPPQALALRLHYLVQLLLDSQLFQLHSLQVFLTSKSND